MTDRFPLFTALIVLSLSAFMVGCQAVAGNPSSLSEGPTEPYLQLKVDGVAFVSPPGKVGETEIGYITQSNAGWVEFIPYAYSYPSNPIVHFDGNGQWWGERSDGTRAMIRAAKKNGLQVMVKPHIWIAGEGWAGSFKMNNEADWQKWEASYQAYVMTFAELAQEEGAEMFCVGTELKQITIDRPDYFGRLADSVRTVFKGKVTYAANWDNYKSIHFWDRMDFIGVDAYFPLLPDDTPEVAPLVKAWEKEKNELKSASEKYQKPILFTEWGYLSVNKSGWRTWELEANLREMPLNMQAQANCYEAMFTAVWDEPWFAGGFVWQWYAHHPQSGGQQDKDHTPQNKPAMEILKKVYGKE